MKKSEKPNNVEEAFEHISQLLGEEDPCQETLLQLLAFTYFSEKTQDQKVQQYNWQTKYLFGALPTKNGAKLEKAGSEALVSVLCWITDGRPSSGRYEYYALKPDPIHVAMAENIKNLVEAGKQAQSADSLRAAEEELLGR